MEPTVTFSDRESYRVGEAVWIEKYPVKWYRDVKQILYLIKILLYQEYHLIMSGIIKGIFLRQICMNI